MLCFLQGSLWGQRSFQSWCCCATVWSRYAQWWSRGIFLPHLEGGREVCHLCPAVGNPHNVARRRWVEADWTPCFIPRPHMNQLCANMSLSVQEATTSQIRLVSGPISQAWRCSILWPMRFQNMRYINYIDGTCNFSEDFVALLNMWLNFSSPEFWVLWTRLYAPFHCRQPTKWELAQGSGGTHADNIWLPL